MEFYSFWKNSNHSPKGPPSSNCWVGSELQFCQAQWPRPGIPCLLIFPVASALCNWVDIKKKCQLSVITLPTSFILCPQTAVPSTSGFLFPVTSQWKETRRDIFQACKRPAGACGQTSLSRAGQCGQRCDCVSKTRWVWGIFWELSAGGPDRAGQEGGLSENEGMPLWLSLALCSAATGDQPLLRESLQAGWAPLSHLCNFETSALPHSTLISWFNLFNYFLFLNSQGQISSRP